MRKTPPPLRLLPAFEASARLGSFKRAAHELNVTPSAVSQQVKSLEAVMDVALFSRQPGGVTLTHAGLALQELAGSVLERYRRGYDRLQQRFTQPVVRISTMAQVAYEWLIPSLPDFQSRHPDIDLRIETSETLVEFEAEWITAAVRVGEGGWPGLEARPLFALQVAAFAAPRLLQDLPVRDLSALARYTLIHSRTSTDDWKTVSEMFGIDLGRNKHLYFDNYFSAIAAAENGLGVVLGLMPLTQRSVDAGRLRKVVDFEAPLGRHCYLVYPPRNLEDPAFQAVAAWIGSVFSEVSG